MTEKADGQIAIVTEEIIREKIYVVRGQRVMLDADLAEIYGYETKNFNRQVKNNKEKFAGDDFMFRLTHEELEELVRCKNFTSRDNFFQGQSGGTRYLPNVFTEQGIYMLMTVLRGELAVRQSRALVRLFKQMKDYLAEDQRWLGQQELLRLSVQTNENTKAIGEIREQMATKDDLVNFMANFMDAHIGKEFLIMDGQTVEADIAYHQIYEMAEQSIFVVDNYIGIKTLALMKDVPEKIKIIIFSDNMGKSLTRLEYEDFVKEYPHVGIEFRKTDGKFHDRFIILDYGAEMEKIFQCGASSKDAGRRITTINRMTLKEIYHPMTDRLLQNEVLVLR
ncbi:MAG: ORF6N domain-containing protein [Lachnospiraceae bacterium]|nr:ORF6N domain-containing protein [Lachnospiraceae bacterium]